MRPFRRTIETLELDGGILCLNFVNTVKSRFESPLHEYIVNYNDLILWSVRTNICNSESAEKLKFYIQRNEENAPKDLNRIMKTREVLYRIFLCISKKKSPSNNDIRYFNKQLSIVFSRISLEINENLDINVVWSPNSFNFQMILNPIIKSAYDLLTSDIVVDPGISFDEPRIYWTLGTNLSCFHLILKHVLKSAQIVVGCFWTRVKITQGNGVI